MYGCETHCIRLIDIWQRVIDEQTFLRGPSDFIQYDPIDFRLRFDKTDRAGDDHVIEQIKKIIFFTSKWKRLSGPIAKSIQWIARLLELFQDFHSASKRLANRIYPMLMICTN